MIVVNFKTYPEATVNDQPIKLAITCQEVFNTYHIPIILCVQATDIFKVTQSVSLPVYAQHIDPYEPGKHTGYVSALAIRQNGALGVMINHSEHRIGMELIQKNIAAAKSEGLKTLVCVENALEAETVDHFNPDMIALEDPVLIGGTVSIVANPEGKQKVEEFVSKHLQALPLVGAGVKDKEDVAVSLQLGAKGVLLASGVTLAPDPKTVLSNLCEGFAS